MAVTSAIPPTDSLPLDQAVRDRITGVLRRDEQNRPLIRMPISDDPSFVRDKNLVVSAGAGSGKTDALVLRMVALVRSGVDLSQIAAITFTRKAAGEMRARFFETLHYVREQLEKKVIDTTDDTTKDLYVRELKNVEKALAGMEHVFIDTIHAFCLRLLRERPIEAGLPPDLSLIEDRDEEILRRKFWREYLRKQLVQNPEEYEQLVEMGIQPSDLFHFFGRLNEYSDLEVMRSPVPRPDLESAVETVRAFVEKWQAARPQPRPLNRDAVMCALDEAEHFMRYRGIRNDGDRAAFIQIFESTLQPDKRKNAKREERGKITAKCWTEIAGIDKSIPTELDNDALPELVINTIRPVLSSWRAYCYEAVYAFAHRAVEAYRDERFKAGKLTFLDLLLGAVRLLRENEDVRKHFQARWTRLLVDEFQDTDPIQAQVLFYLTGSNTDEKSWQDCVPRDGSLFIVGDAKQSIYRFRRADVQVFEEVCALIEKYGGLRLELTTNFRSTFAFCTWCNGTFQDIFEPEGRKNPPYQTSFQSLHGFRADKGSTPVRWMDLPDIKRHEAKDIAQKEAEKIARFIQAACDGHPDAYCAGEDAIFEGKARYGDFLILGRVSKRFPIYARALEQLGIPYEISGGKSLGTSDELRAVIGLFECILRPDDPVARVAYLQGLFNGLSATTLYHFKRANGTFDGSLKKWKESSLTGLPENERQQIKRAAELLIDLRKNLRDKPASAALEAALEKSGFLALAARSEAGSTRAGNLLRILSMIRTSEMRGKHWTEILEELRLVAAGEIEAEELTLETGSGSAVRIMTVHQAKGLQAKVVFLVDPYDKSHRPRQTEHVDRSKAGKPFAVIPAYRPKGEYHFEPIALPPGWNEQIDGKPTWEEEAERFSTAEHDRLTYVAATRARDLLVVTYYRHAKDSGFWCRLFPKGTIDPDKTLPSLIDDETIAAPAKHVVWPGRQTIQANRTARRIEVARATYRTLRPSSLNGSSTGALAAVSTSETQPRLTTGQRYGKIFGNVVHHLFEHAIRHRHLEPDSEAEASLLDTLLAEETVQPFAVERAACRTEEYRSRIEARQSGWLTRARERATAALKSFRLSALWDEIKQSDQVYTEVPFATGTRTNGFTEVTSGSIDLVYQTPAGWKIVDYKTSRIHQDTDIRILINRYTSQLQTYAKYWQEVTGAEVSSLFLYFTEIGRVGEIPAST